MRVWMWVAVAAGLACAGLVATGVMLPGLEEVSWAAGAGSFVLAAAALGMAWPRRNAPPPPRPPAGPRVENRASDTDNAVQVGRVDGDVNIHQAVGGPRVDPVPGWVQTAVAAREADPSRLGAHAARPDAQGDHQPPYVPRDADADLDRRLQAAVAAPRGGMVLVAGPPTAGKTRALAAAVARTLPDRMLLAPPEDADLRPLPAWLAERAGAAPDGWVVWLDDVDRRLPYAGLELPLLDELGAAGAIVAATIRLGELEKYKPAATTADGAKAVGYQVLKAPALELERIWKPGERERAAAAGDERLAEAADQEAFGVAEYLAAGPDLQRAWRHAPDAGHPRGFALVAAAVDLADTGLSAPQPRERIEQAAEHYLPAPPPAPEGADAAWEWATEVRSGVAGLLVPTDHAGRCWRAFDYLTAEEPLPEAAWQAAIDWAEHEDNVTIGITAYTADRNDVAEQAWRKGVEAGDTDAMNNLGVLLKEGG
uniref:sel1 repeat family protein n=1 Tax=Nocardiopsis baichengensis TaxID=280240 RepID=UPI0012681563